MTPSPEPDSPERQGAVAAREQAAAARRRWLAEPGDHRLPRGRSALLERLGLDEPQADRALDRLARLATRLLDVPISLVTLVGDERQMFPGQAGMPPGPYERGTPILLSVCRYVIEDGAPVVVADARRDERLAGHPGVAALNITAFLGWPLVTSDGTALGGFCAIDPEPHAWTREDVDTVRDLADAAIGEIEARAARRRAERALERERYTSETLQFSLLPGELPRVPGLRLAARYLPAENVIGGDWYDVFRLAGDRVGFALGDVVGHGIEAAAAAGQLRNALRGYALEDDAPEHVLARLNDLAHLQPLAAFSSLVYGVLDVPSRRLRWAVAGHPPPVVRGAGPGVDANAGAPPLGVLPAGSPFGVRDVTLAPDTTLLLYTDGLIERRNRPLDEGLELLRETVEQGPDDPDALCDAVLRRLRPTGGDDVALLVLTVDGAP